MRAGFSGVLRVDIYICVYLYLRIFMFAGSTAGNTFARECVTVRRENVQLLTTDLWALATMKNAVKCDT